MPHPAVRILLALCLASGLEAAVQQNFYVDPAGGSDANDGKSTAQAFKTIPAAQAAVRALTSSMTGDIVVNLKGGMHTLTDSLKFAAADGGSGANYVIYQSYPNERAIISGGRIITGWSLDATTGLYKATVGTTINSRNFFVNGIRCNRASSEMYYHNSETVPFGWSGTNVGIAASGVYAGIANWGNITDMEFSFSGNWLNHRVRIASISGNTAALVQPAANYLVNSTGVYHNIFQLQNAFELLNMPGEWYLNRTTGVLWYKPRAGEDMSRDVAILADLPTALNANGVKNLKLTGLQFSYFDFKRIANPNNWCYVGRYGSGWVDYPNWSHTNQQWQETHLWLENTTNVAFERNVFTHLGSYAIRSNRANTNITVTGNVFTDLGGGGVSFGYRYGGSAATADSNVVCTDNYFENFALDLYDDVAIYLCAVKGALIANNEIYGSPYCPILMRGASPFRGVTSRNNRIVGYTCNPLLKDGGSHYLCDPLGGVIVRENFIQRGAYAALYCDVNSQNINLLKNVIECMIDYMPMPFQGVNAWTYIWHERSQNILADGNFTNWNNAVNEQSGNNNVIRNTVYEAAPLFPHVPWANATARDIVAKSGLEAAYRDIRPGFGTNVALGKTVTASASDESAAWGTRYLVDGKTLTNGASGIGFSGSAAGWVQVDLGIAQPVNRIVLWPRQDYGPGNRAGACYPRDFRIDVSADNSTWTTVAQEEGSKKSDNHGTPFLFPTTNARYVKLSCTKLRNEFGVGSKWQLAEMEVFSTDAVGAVTPGTPVRHADAGIRVTQRNGVWTIANPGLFPAHVTIHDMAGRLVASAQTNKAAVMVIPGVSRRQATGNYCVKIETPSTVLTRRVSVVR